jgi:hypothetical protein
MQSQDKQLDKVVAAIEALDLDPIKFKLMNREEGEGWSREYVDQLETAYKRFLTLVVKYPHEPIVPSKEVDKFWHGHILDTMKYAQDCQNVFGYFLHHFPYFGMRGEADAANLAEAGRKTARLYESEFSATARTPSAAMCGATGEARDVLNTSVRPKLDNPAMCGAATRAMCGATLQGSAMCGTARPAMCGATAEGPAMCGAAVEADSAMCGAAVVADRAAMCGAARPAMCGAKINVETAMHA